jgi:hypothetical protein
MFTHDCISFKTINSPRVPISMVFDFVLVYFQVHVVSALRILILPRVGFYPVDGFFNRFPFYFTCHFVTQHLLLLRGELVLHSGRDERKRTVSLAERWGGRPFGRCCSFQLSPAEERCASDSRSSGRATTERVAIGARTPEDLFVFISTRSFWSVKNRETWSAQDYIRRIFIHSGLNPSNTTDGRTFLRIQSSTARIRRKILSCTGT